MTTGFGLKISPDVNGNGFVDAALNPGRYDGHTDDPNEVAGIIKSIMPSGVRVLDVGCGTGSVALIVNKGKNNDVIAIEPDLQRSEVARSRGLDVTTGFLDHEILLNRGPFDVAVISDVLEHLSSPHELVQLVAAGLSSGGRIIASVPNAAHWSLRLSLLLGKFEYAATGLCDATHLRWFTAKTLISFFERQGFKVDIVRFSAGVTLDVYTRPLFMAMPIKLRYWMIRRAAVMIPTLFGCQVIVSCRAAA